jgi:NAD(P)-dependent dehydrogenase (short-subunit alcohol dehydrogenase family)
MKNKIVLITGATGGIGKQTAITLAKMGATVVITGRNMESGEKAVAAIKKLSGNPNIELLLADVSTKGGIIGLVSQFKQKFDKLDVVINNAGSAASERKLSTDGIEMNFAINVLAPWFLATQLMDYLRKSPSGRIITLMGGDVPKKLDQENLQALKSFDGINYYSQSKLTMMALMFEYAQQIKETGVTVNICYPGQASTSMTQSVTAGMLPFLMRPLFPLFKFLVKPDGGKSAEKASRSSVFLATSKDVEGKTGLYVDKHVKIKEMPQAAANEENRKQVWNYVNQLLTAHPR